MNDFEQKVRERWNEMARDCPWKCRFDGKSACLCRAAARLYVADSEPPEATFSNVDDMLTWLNE